MEEQPDVEMVTTPKPPARDQTPLMILAGLAQDIQDIQKNASIVYKQLPSVGQQLYNIIEDKKTYVICEKSEADLIAVHVNLLDLYQTPISQTLKGAQEAEHKVNEAIGKLESHYDSQLNQKDEQLNKLKVELLLVHQELRKVLERQQMPMQDVPQVFPPSS